MFALLSILTLSALAVALPSRTTGISGKRQCVSTSGHIQVLDANDFVHYGRLGNNDLSQGAYGLVGLEDTTDTLAVVVPCVGSMVGNMQATNGASSYMYVGAAAPYAANNNSTDIGLGSANWLIMTGTAETPVGSVPMDVGSDYATFARVSGVESAIWTLNSANQVLPNWVNSDGSTPQITMFWVESSTSGSTIGYLGMTGDYAAFEAANAALGNIYEVVLYLY